MRPSRSSRPSFQHSVRFAGAGFAALALIVIDSPRSIAGPVQRTSYGHLPVPTSTRARIPSAPAASVTVQDLIAEAAQRFGVPATWIAEVMAVESRGRVDALSPKGAVGLMQVMPATYADLAVRHGLGPDPWNPRDNVLAGTAYLRELYDRYGAPGFLVAYNAGPGRWDDYRLRARPLPAETVAYLARLGPLVGGSVLPAQTVASIAVVRSPKVAPIFVSLSTDPARVQANAERDRIIRILEANASVLSRADSIFTAESHAVDPPSNDVTGDDRTVVQPPSRNAPTDDPAPYSPPENTLFPRRTGAGSR